MNLLCISHGHAWLNEHVTIVIIARAKEGYMYLYMYTRLVEWIHSIFVIPSYSVLSLSLSYRNSSSRPF